jgi:uncharacterized membrane protein YeiH
MLHLLEHLGIAVAAISGVLAARGKQVDLFGVIVLALVTAFGGGTLRDLMVGDFPVAWIRDPNLLINATVVAVAAFCIARYRELPLTVLLVADAFALALYTMVGTDKALHFHVSPPAAVAMGVITGVAGGIIRDVLTGEIPLVFRPTIHLYATAAFFGAAVFVLLERWHPGAPGNLLMGAAATLVLRLAAIRWRIGLPVFETRMPGE